MAFLCLEWDSSAVVGSEISPWHLLLGDTPLSCLPSQSDQLVGNTTAVNANRS